MKPCIRCKVEKPIVEGFHRNEQRRQLRKSSASFYAWLKRQGYPSEGYRVLCHNCNCAYGFYGHCPHATPVRRVQGGGA